MDFIISGQSLESTYKNNQDLVRVHHFAPTYLLIT